MKIKKLFAHKKPAQAMVEFAIALPVLLLLLYGILEAGRYLFLYSTVVTASRQAVRYGTATGDGGGATPVYGVSRAVVPRYRDCAGIRGAGNAVAYITRGGFTYQIAWDKGPTDATADRVICTTGAATEVSGAPTDQDLEGNSTRLIVTASTQFVPLVKLVPFSPRTITATSARTILYKVPIQVEQAPIIVPQSPTTTTITSDTPDPSQMGQTVTVTVVVADVDDPTNIPQGTVDITGADNSCTIPLVNGTGSCSVSWAASGTYTLAAVYTPSDEDHLPSTDPDGEQHTVQKAPTIVHLIGVSPDGSVPGQPVTFAFNVTGGITTPTGTVTVDGGGSATCTTTLAGAAGNCTITFNSKGTKTVTITYNGDSTHETSFITIGFVVSDLPPTAKPTATITPRPSATPLPSVTPTPTQVPTPVPSCKGITHGPIKYSGSNMTMTVTNPFPFTLIMSGVNVTWNHDKGHKTGSDKTLVLKAAWVNGTPFWSGTSGPNESSKPLPGPASFPPGTSTITFTFDKSYDNPLSSDQIVINWLTPGCEGDPVDSSH